MSRDYTYIDDIIQGILLVLEHTPCLKKDHHPIYNIEIIKTKFTQFYRNLEPLGKKLKKKISTSSSRRYYRNLWRHSKSVKRIGIPSKNPYPRRNSEICRMVQILCCF